VTICEFDWRLPLEKWTGKRAKSENQLTNIPLTIQRLHTANRVNYETSYFLQMRIHSYGAERSG